MKIGLVLPYSIAKGGGVKEIVCDLKSGLEAKGHAVKIITPLPRDIEGVDTADVLFLGGGTEIKSPTHTTMQFSASVSTDAIDAMLEAEQFDILHFHEPEVPVLSRQILARSKAVNIATFHAVVPETITSRTFVKVVMPYTLTILKYLHELTAVSEAAAEYVSGLTDQHISIIPNGIDLTRYTARPAGKKPTKTTSTILYIGRLERRKGVKYLLRAFQLLMQTEENVELLIAGDGPDREKLELLAEDLKLSHVTFLGYISDEEKLRLLAQADIFCSPAVYGESFGLVLLEAMAAGAVTVAGNNSGYVSVLQELGAVSIVNPHDDAEFARRLQLLLNEKSLRTLWQEWAADYVQQFSYPRIIDRYEALYKDALKKHKVS